MKSIRSIESLNLNTRRSVDIEPTHSERREEAHSDNQSRQQFSFKQTRSHNQNALRQKYSEIYNDLKAMSSTDVIELLLEELEQNQRCKKQIFDKTNKIEIMENELNQSKQMLKKKRETINLLCETESKNLQLIEKLQNKISKKNQYGRDTHYQKKYQQLSIYMNEYIRNINIAQQQFKKAYSSIKNQNTRLTRQVEEVNSQYSQLLKKMQIINQKVKRYECQITQLYEIRSKMSNNINILNEENQILKKQIQIIQENIRITDRLEMHISKQHNQLSSELDFIRDKICQNQNISKDIIDKLQQSSSHCEKINKDKDKFYESLQRAKDKRGLLQKQISTIKRKNQQLEQDLRLIKKQYDIIANERDEIEEDLMKQRIEKQSIRRQLLGLADKVKLMESSYRKQIEQSQKIKEELFKFWENKEKKDSFVRDMSTKTLCEIKTNGCEYSQTTISLSEKQSKLSLFNKKSEYQASFHNYQKQNQENQYGKDSLCE